MLAEYRSVATRSGLDVHFDRVMRRMKAENSPTWRTSKARTQTIPAHSSPHFSQGKLLFGEGEEDRRKTMRIVAPKALIAIWL